MGMSEIFDLKVDQKKMKEMLIGGLVYLRLIQSKERVMVVDYYFKTALELFASWLGKNLLFIFGLEKESKEEIRDLRVQLKQVQIYFERAYQLLMMKENKLKVLFNLIIITYLLKERKMEKYQKELEEILKEKEIDNNTKKKLLQRMELFKSIIKD
jgi:hypothetical protein